MDASDLILGAAFFLLIYAAVNPSTVPEAFQSIESAAGGAMSTVSQAAIEAIARAIATAEGFYVSGSLPQRAHNPGDLEMGDIGFGVINGKTRFGTDQDGWNALYEQIGRMLHLHGVSLYSPTMSIAQVAAEWVNGKTYPSTDSDAWAANFSRVLGVTPDMTLQDVAARYSV